MKKSPIIAAAIAATIAGSAFAADTTIYGNIRLEVVNKTDLNMDSSKLVVGFKASEDMGNGMTGFMHMELEHDDANKESDGSSAKGWTNDKSYVGVKGDFGQVTLGRQADAAGFACGGTDIFTKVTGEACGAGAVNGGLDNALVYVGGTGNVTFALGATLNGSQTEAGDNTIVAAKYAADNFSIGFQMSSFDDVPALKGKADETTSVIGGTYNIGEMTIGATMADNGTDNAIAVALKMPLAGGSFRVGVDQGDAVDDTTHLQFTKSLSKSVYTGVEFASVDGDEDDMIAGWIGMNF
jgi:predicted porin